MRRGNWLNINHFSMLHPGTSCGILYPSVDRAHLLNYAKSTTILKLARHYLPVVTPDGLPVVRRISVSRRFYTEVHNKPLICASDDRKRDHVESRYLQVITSPSESKIIRLLFDVAEYDPISSSDFPMRSAIPESVHQTDQIEREDIASKTMSGIKLSHYRLFPDYRAVTFHNR